jgi:hypothetical protein
MVLQTCAPLEDSSAALTKSMLKVFSSLNQAAMDAAWRMKCAWDGPYLPCIWKDHLPQILVIC